MPFTAIHNLISLDLLRWWLAFRAGSGPLRQYYAADYATLDKPWREVEFLAVDLETTGLDPRKDVVVSIGWVPIVGGAVRLAQAGYSLVRVDRPMPGESAVLHGILDSHVEDAPPLADVLPEFLAALRGRIPVAHHALVEQGFLDAACRSVYGLPLRVPYVDTLALERRRAARTGREVKSGEMRLQACRDRYGLPRYRGHHALADALACAELLLAQATYMDGKQATRLQDLLV
ncbi:MAG: DNA polymerase III subunit epsilon [Caenispirillum sp.]|nr:DNA polymerase III subunit epsilon [Caenispirillum sp.]